MTQVIQITFNEKANPIFAFDCIEGHVVDIEEVGSFTKQDFLATRIDTNDSGFVETWVINKENAELEEANKANEWHYIKNKDFPNTKGEYLVCRIKSKYSILAFDGSFWITGVQDDPYDNIIAWKEIVPPKDD